MTRASLEAAVFTVAEDYEDSMDIHTPLGSTVTFHCKGGYVHEQEAARVMLTPGKHYRVEEIRIGDWSSTVRVSGGSGWFNTCLFGPALETASKEA